MTRAAAAGVLALMVGLSLAASDAGKASALLTDASSVPANTLSLDVLDPPTNLQAAGGTSVQLTWTATPDLYATGYRVLRATAAGGPYTEVAVVTPRTTSTYADTPPLGTVYYVLTAYIQNWRSVASNEVTCTSTFLVFVC